MSESPRRRLSARMRIVGMTVLVVAVALAITVVVLRQVLLSEQAQRVDRALQQEGLELVEYVRSVTPAEAESPRAFARRVLTGYLEQNVTDRDEVLVAVQDGVAFLQSSGAPGDVTPFVDDFADVTEPTFLDVDSDAGPVRILAQPVLAAGEQVGVLAIAWFTAEERASIDRTIRDAAIIAGAALLAAAALAWVVAGRVLRPIGLLAETARDITEHDLSRRLPVQGSDEIAALIVSFNSMLDRLESVVDTQRRFLDDAGHELRTPITVMRGHLELAGDDPDRLAESRSVVLAELDRMGRIVDDLLVLAKSEQFDFLSVAPIDSDELLTSLLPKVRSLADRDWRIDQVPTGIIHADAERLTQALLNLAANAARHTPPGGEIALGGRFDDDRFSMWVRDTGEGIDAADHERIFQRFRRGTTQRAPGGSAGLGLSIVRAITDAHGGTVTLDSARGEGATFTITIPVEPRPDDGFEEVDDEQSSRDAPDDVTDRGEPVDRAQPGGEARLDTESQLPPPRAGAAAALEETR